MNKGTKLRTILVIAVSVHTALMATDLTGFENETVNLVYKIASIIANFIIVAISTYYNNDYTEEACIGTGYTRYQKALKKGTFVGEDFTEGGEEYDLQDTEQ